MSCILRFGLLFSCVLLLGCNPRCDVLRDLHVPLYMYTEPFVERVQQGDTLTLHLFAPYQTLRLDTYEEVDVRNATIWESGLSVLTYVRNLGGGASERTLTGYNIVPVKGSIRYDSRNVLRISFVRGQQGFVFEAKVVLTERGVARFSHLRAIGWMNRRCDKIYFTPLIGGPGQNEHLIFEFLQLTPHFYQWQNHLYVKVE